MSTAHPMIPEPKCGVPGRGFVDGKNGWNSEEWTQLLLPGSVDDCITDERLGCHGEWRGAQDLAPIFADTQCKTRKFRSAADLTACLELGPCCATRGKEVIMLMEGMASGQQKL